jgi:hypothetical protein
MCRPQDSLQTIFRIHCNQVLHELIPRWQERPKTRNCSNLVVVLVLRGFSQFIQFLLLGFGLIGAACARVNREHLPRGQHFRIVGIIKLLADGDRLLAHAAIQFVSAIPFQSAQFVALVPLFLSSRKRLLGFFFAAFFLVQQCQLVFRARVFRVSLCRFLQPFLGVLVAFFFQIGESQEVGGVGEGWLRGRVASQSPCANWRLRSYSSAPPVPACRSSSRCWVARPPRGEPFPIRGALR